MGFFDAILGPVVGAGTSLLQSAAPLAQAAAPVAAAASGGGTLGAIGAIAGAAGGSGAQGTQGPGGPMGPMADAASALLTPHKGIVAKGSSLQQMSAVATGLLTLATIRGIVGPANGGNRKVTVVFTINRAGAVDIRDIQTGRPLVMSRDAQRMKKTAKSIRKLERAVPTRTRAPSKRKMLEEAILDEAERTIVRGAVPHTHQLPPGH